MAIASSTDAGATMIWGIGVALGMGLGVAIGAILGNIGMGIGIGIAFGMAGAGAVYAFHGEKKNR